MRKNRLEIKLSDTELKLLDLLSQKFKMNKPRTIRKILHEYSVYKDFYIDMGIVSKKLTDNLKKKGS